MDGKKNLVSQSVKVSNWLEKDLKKAADQDGRTLAGECLYFLQVMLAVADYQPQIPIKRDYAVERGALYGQVKFSMDIALDGNINRKAEGYGLKPPELIRLFWMMALDLRKSLAPKRRLIRKEDFLELIIQKFCRMTIH